MKRYAVLAALLLATWMLVPTEAQQYWRGVRFQDGTAAAPAVASAANPTAGMYFSGAQPAFSAGGTGYVLVGSDSLQLKSTTALNWSSGTLNSANDTSISRRAAGEFGWTAVLFAALGTPANGTFCYCSDCTIANPCAGSGTGALAKRLNGVWVCN